MKARDVAKEFSISVETVITTKNNYKCSYEDLYDMYKERMDTLDRCQTKCALIDPVDIKDCFVGNSNRSKLNQAWSFLNRRLYQVRDSMVRPSMYERCKAILKHIEG
jgi:hypothetical protein